MFNMHCCICWFKKVHVFWLNSKPSSCRIKSGSHPSVAWNDTRRKSSQEQLLQQKQCELPAGSARSSQPETWLLETSCPVPVASGNWSWHGNRTQAAPPESGPSQCCQAVEHVVLDLMVYFLPKLFNFLLIHLFCYHHLALLLQPQ